MTIADLGPTDETLELRARYRAFMEEHVYPNEGTLFAEDEEEFRTAFYPVPEHLRVFEPNVYLIIGYHGAGKTALFKAAVG
ncbi:MAG: hypothetical protein NZL88_10495, partial [Gaiellaceae bacterium]|nr:hypothetical protein [Gaiellaceae bacterium]